MKTPVLIALAAVLLHSAHVAAQGPDIQHDPVGCIVAGKFPKVDACFAPAAEVARARVYFKKLDGAHWYWVDFTPGEPCFNAVLPRPTKTLKQMMYYVEVVDRQHRESRTDDRTVDVVAEKGGCSKDVPVAGWVQNATVSVGAPVGAPALPVGFTATSVVGGGIGTSVIVGGVAATSAAAVGGATLLSGGANEADAEPTAAPTSEPVATAAPTATATPVPTPTAAPTPEPTAPPQPFRASISIAPTSGVEPLTVTFDGCASTGQNLQFGYDYDGDGVDDQRGPCRVTRTYTLSGVTFAGVRSASSGAGRVDYRARMTVWERITGGQTHSEFVSIRVDSKATPTPKPCDRLNPVVTLLDPRDSASVSPSEPLRATATDADGISALKFKAEDCTNDGICTGTPVDIGTPSPVPGPGPNFSANWTPFPNSCGDWKVWAQAMDNCGNTGVSSTVLVFVSSSCSAFASASSVTWTSELGVPSASGVVVLNGTTSAVTQGMISGRTTVTDSRGSRVELTLQNATGQGLWTFSVRDGMTWDPTKVRVTAGEVVSLTGEGIVFRLKGRPGERVGFTFE